MTKYKIETLTNTEIQSLQIDAAMRLVGKHSVILTQLNNDISQAIIAKGKADIALQTLKNDKSTIIELIRALKIMVQNG